MITKHFYRLDEVQAALLYAIHLGRPKEAAFWCEELIESDFWTEAWGTLLEAYLWFTLVTDSNWIQHRVFDEDKAMIHQACYRLCCAKKDNFLWAVLVTVDKDMPDRICGKRPEGLFYESELDAYLCAAIYQGKAACAWWAYKKSQFKYANRIPETNLCRLMECVGLVGKAWTRIGLCASVLLACTPEPLDEVVPMNEALLCEIDEWSDIIGNRKRRIYPIVPECLYGRTRRGCMERTQSTRSELYEIQDLLYDGTIDIEEFYQKTFPDDIPDEWSLADQKKSHGPGVLKEGETITLAKFGRIWMTHPCMYCWGFREWTDGLVINATSMEEVAFVHDIEEKEEKEDSEIKSLLSSVHKRLLIV